MPEPTALPEIASDANYPAGAEPEAGTPTKVDPAREALGYRPDEKPTAQEHNWLFNLIWQWIVWFQGYVTADQVLPISSKAWVNDTVYPTYGDSSVVLEDYVWSVGVPLAALSLLKTVVFEIDGDGAVDIEARLSRRNADGTNDVLETTNFTNIPNGYANYTLTVSPEIELAADKSYFLVLIPGAAGGNLGSTFLTFKRRSPT